MEYQGATLKAFVCHKRPLVTKGTQISDFNLSLLDTELPYRSYRTSFITFSCAKLVQDLFASIFFFLPLNDIPVTHRNHVGDLTLYYILSQMTWLATPYHTPRRHSQGGAQKRNFFRNCPCLL